MEDFTMVSHLFYAFSKYVFICSYNDSRSGYNFLFSSKFDLFLDFDLTGGLSWSLF